MTRTTPYCTFLLLAAALPLAAQTTAPKTSAPAHTAAGTAAHHAAPGGCVTLPELSPKIPALPATVPCAKTLYTVTRVPAMKLDYASPLVSAPVREELNGGPATFSLNYIDTKLGTGDPVVQHKCINVQYTGYLMDGTKFDSSRDRPGAQPISFLYGGHQVIPGWDTGFEGMKMGGERRLFIPYELAYGENGRGPIPAKAELIFDVEAVSQSEPRAGAPPGAQCSKAPAPPQRPQPPAGAAQKPAPPTGTTATPPAGVPEAALGLVTVEVQSATSLPQLSVPTGGQMFVGEGTKPEMKEVRPRDGSILLALGIAIKNPSGPFSLTRENVTLRPPPGSPQNFESAAPLYWEKILTGIGTGDLAEQGNTMTIDHDTVLHMVIEVPISSPENLVLWIGDRSLGSLQSLGMKALK